MVFDAFAIMVFTIYTAMFPSCVYYA